MDLPQEELQYLTIPDILKESISIPNQSPKTFSLITLSLIFPLSFVILAHSLFTDPILQKLQDSPDDFPTNGEWTKLLTFQFFYFIFLFAFSLLAVAAVVFTVASIYTSKTVSFESTMNAMPSVLKRLFMTFIWIFLLMAGYYFICLVFMVLLVVAIDIQNLILFVISLMALFFMFLFIHIYISGLWHLSSVVSVLEPLHGFAAIKKSYELLQGRSIQAFVLVFGYFTICGVINGAFGTIVVNGGEDFGFFTRFMVTLFLVCVLVIVNLVMLLVQSVFYYVCKSYHHQEIDKSALCNHLGGYLGEYVPLASNIQMDHFDI